MPGGVGGGGGEVVDVVGFGHFRGWAVGWVVVGRGGGGGGEVGLLGYI